MAAPKVTVVLVGGGTIAPLHAKHLLESPDCELVAIIDPFPPGERLAKELSVAHFSDVPALLKTLPTQPDAYIVCVPSGLHVSVALSIVAVAKPKVILVEKPFSTDSISGKELIAKTNECGVKVLAGHHRRFNPYLALARQVVVEGQIGKLNTISGLWTCKKNDGYFEPTWRKSRLGGGGPVWTNMVHDIDALHYIVGSSVAKVCVFPTARDRTHDGISPADLVEEGGVFMLHFKNGVVGTFVLSDNVVSPYGWDMATGENPLYPKAEGSVDCYRIFGTKGTLSVPDNTLWTYEKKQAEKLNLEIGWNVPLTRETLAVRDAIPFQEQVKNLVQVARGECEPRCSGRDGLAAVQVCEAIMKGLTAGDGNIVLVDA